MYLKNVIFYSIKLTASFVKQILKIKKTLKKSVSFSVTTKVVGKCNELCKARFYALAMVVVVVVVVTADINIIDFF